jgi:hypothetical protein
VGDANMNSECAGDVEAFVLILRYCSVMQLLELKKAMKYFRIPGL